MAWLIRFAQSSIGKKLIMSLTGLFLCLFLVIHLIGNLQLLQADGGEAFNTYASFMSNNGLIKFVSIGTYFFILWHAVQGILIALSNAKKGNGKYAVKSTKSNSFASRNMVWLGLMVLIFLGIHMGDFWYKMKFTDELAMKTYPGYDHAVKDLYAQVYTSFHESWIVVVYLISMLALGLHLQHGFQSAFQTMGLENSKYTNIIKFVGNAFAILVPLGFALIPIYIYLA